MTASIWQDQRHDVVLMNFGGPQSAADVAPFLTRLFEDPLILRLPLPEPLKSVAQKLLARFIVSRRAKKAEEQYRRIGYSPINKYTQAQADHLERLLKQVRPNTKVHVVNRYTPPFASDVVRNIPTDSRLFALTLYPHFSHATAGTSFRDFDQAWKAHNGKNTKGGVRVFSWWWQQSWIEWCVRAIMKQVAASQAERPDSAVTIMVSAHGLPQAYVDRGDQYVHEIAAHYREIVARVKDEVEQKYSKLNCRFELSFQSRVGPVEWVRPYTEDAIAEYGKGGGALIMMPISFVSDHIETLFEMDITYREDAMRSGFASYYRVELPNSDPLVANILAETLKQFGF